MDVRDRRFWQRKARVQLLRQEIQGIMTARMAQAQQKVVQRHVDRLIDQIKLLEPSIETPLERQSRWQAGLNTLRRLKRRR